MTINLRPLHNLYQTISPASFLENEDPLVAVSQLERRGRTSTGEIEWVIGVGMKGTEYGEQIWWSTRLSSEGIQKLVIEQLKGTAITEETVVENIRTRWLEGRLDVKGLENLDSSAKERQPIQLVIWLRDNVPLSIPFSPCEESPFPLLSIMAHLIPPYLSASKSEATLRSLEPQLTATQREQSTLAADNDYLRSEIKELKRKLREGGAGGGGRAAKRTRTEEDASQSQSQAREGSPSQRQSQRDTSAPLSPQKKGRPGIDFKAVMRPGTKGYAGSTNRVGRNLDDEWEEPESDSE
ncbi:hypothetical protein JCM5350_004490 [Sporobolomyces pararoseus]